MVERRVGAVVVVKEQRTIGQNQVILRHQKYTFPRANGRASGPVLTSRFLFVPDHSAAGGDGDAGEGAEGGDEDGKVGGGGG